ncbi:HTH domain-containing protein [Listeria aquatica]|uniref:HTH domain-containing protein n=1 Tax=Listeria aquatica TaxID=1494960 RepID=UPI0031F54F11
MEYKEISDENLTGFIEVLQKDFAFSEQDFYLLFGMSTERLKRLSPESDDYALLYNRLASLVLPFTSEISADERLETLIDYLHTGLKIPYPIIASYACVEEIELKKFVNGQFGILLDSKKFEAYTKLNTLYNILTDPHNFFFSRM